MPIRATRRQRGIAENFANQLAQMAVGWKIMFDGPSILNEPDVGVMEFDAIRGSGWLNGKAAELPMARLLKGWTVAELQRQELAASWLNKAIVEVRYSRSEASGNLETADLSAVARIDCAYGEASGAFSNQQPLLRKL